MAIDKKLDRYIIDNMDKKKCACGRYYVAQEWKTEEGKAQCLTCFIRRKFLENVFGDLTIREQKILDTRFGITNGQTQTLEEVGKIFGVTRERIRQIEAKAIEKLKDYQTKM